MKWIKTPDGLYISGHYAILKHPNTRTKQHDGTTWLVLYLGRRIGVQPLLADAKQTAKAHQEQQGEGVI